MTFVTWLWPSPISDARYNFNAKRVNVLFRMIDRHYQAPHRNVCVTNIPHGIDPSIQIVKDTEDFKDVGNPSGRHNPSCFRRLRMFRRDAAHVFGDRIVSLDLDTVITGDLTGLFDRPEDFIVWGQSDRRSKGWYNCSLLYLKAGARPEVWEQFNPKISPHQAKRAGSAGSDQGWIGYILGRNEATWNTDDGVYSYRVHLQHHVGLPENARVVHFHGKEKPWDSTCLRRDWIQAHYH